MLILTINNKKLTIGRWGAIDIFIIQKYSNKKKMCISTLSRINQGYFRFSRRQLNIFIFRKKKKIFVDFSYRVKTGESFMILENGNRFIFAKDLFVSPLFIYRVKYTL